MSKLPLLGLNPRADSKIPSRTQARLKTTQAQPKSELGNKDTGDVPHFKVQSKFKSKTTQVRLRTSPSPTQVRLEISPRIELRIKGRLEIKAKVEYPPPEASKKRDKILPSSPKRMIKDVNE